jgi:hypothetical protein
MNGITFRVLEQFPEPAHSALVDEAFADHEESALPSAVSDEVAAARSGATAVAPDAAIRIGAFRGDALVGRTCSNPEGPSLLHKTRPAPIRRVRKTGDQR